MELWKFIWWFAFFILISLLGEYLARRQKRLSKDRDEGYPGKIKKDILANNPFGIQEVNDLKDIKELSYVREEYPNIAKLIKSGDMDIVYTLEDSVKTSEYLSIMQFTDETGKAYIVTIYDSDELWQDPTVIEIFPQ